MISEEDSSEETNWRRSKRQIQEEPEFNITNFTTNTTNITNFYLTSYQLTQELNIYPTCEDGEVFYCQNNTSNESLDENCGKILMFNSETRSCSCEGSNRRKRNSGNILRKGWSKYIRLYFLTYLWIVYALEFRFKMNTQYVISTSSW